MAATITNAISNARADGDSTPHLVVATVVEREGRFLCVEERIAGRLVINQPAGHYEAGETLIEAAVRETLEETGWRVQPTDVLGIYEWHPPQLPYPFVRLTFVATAVEHEPDRALDHGIERAVWLTRDELVAETARLRGPAVQRCVDDYLAGQRFPLSLVQRLVADF